jgi:hypothetical protein
MLVVFQDLTVPAAFCFATGMYATGSIPVLLIGTRTPELVRRAVTAVHQGVVHAGHDLNRAIATTERLAGQAARDAALTVAALLILTIPTGEVRR